MHKDVYIASNQMQKLGLFADPEMTFRQNLSFKILNFSSVNIVHFEYDFYY